MAIFPHDDAVDAVSAPHRDAAEEVRAHLVAIRGGAIFLSSSDTSHLLNWLDRGVAVADILRAIERAADARRKKQSRVPLTLGQAKRHLGKPTRGAFSTQAVQADVSAPLDPLVRRVDVASEDDPAAEQLRVLAGALRGIRLDSREAVARDASKHIREFHLDVWEGLSDLVREGFRVRARDQLGDLRTMLDEVALTAIVEENARDSVRSGYGWLSMATVWDLLESWVPEGT